MDLLYDGEDVLELLEVNIRVRIRHPRIIKERINFNLEDPHFVEKFRLPKICVEFLIENLGRSIVRLTNCNEAFSPLQQILLTLHWLGNGSQYHGIGAMHGVSKASICRCVNKICPLISQQLLYEEVKWPQNGNNVAQSIFRRAGMPCIAGAVDGSLIPIDAPTINEQAYVDRKGLHSLNVMLIAGADYRFYAVNSNYQGSVHDSRVLQCSRFYNKWNNEGWRPFPRAIIIGDSAYPLRTWLFTCNVPSQIPDSPAKNRFLFKLKKTRQIIECSIGQLKEIFPCLNRLRLKTPTRCANVVNACVTLYNIRKRMTEENDIFFSDYDGIEDEDGENMEEQNDNENNREALEALRNYVNHFNL